MWAVVKNGLPFFAKAPVVVILGCSVEGSPAAWTFHVLSY